MTFGAMAGLGTNIPSYLTEVNNTISSLSSGYKVNEVDLSGFKMYWKMVGADRFELS